jgi:tetratricopeptide (TPR) repeat protein
MIAVWFMVLSVFVLQVQAALMDTITQTTTGKCSPAIGHADGSVTVVCQEGVPTEQFQLLAEELGVTKAALTSFFKILEQQRVPPEDLDSKLREIATNYKRLHAQLSQFLSEDPTVMALRREANKALEAGDFAQVEILLRQAEERDLHAIQEQQASLKKRQLSAAATSAELGALKNTQLAYAAAATHYRQAAAVVPQEEVITQATYLHEAGVAWWYAGQYADARSALEQALALREQGLSLEHPDVAQSLTYLVLLYRTLGRYADAEPHARRALTISEKVFGPDHPDVAQSLTSLAALSVFQGRYAEAEPLLRRALRIREQVLGPEHRHVAESLNPLAMLYHSQGRSAEAEPLFRRALRIREQALGPEDPHVALGLNNLAVLFQAQGRYAEAEPHFLRALAIWEKVHGPEHPHVAMNLNNLATLSFSQGHYAEAEPRFQRALAIWEKVFGPEHPDLALGLNNLATLYLMQGRYAEAEPRFQRALAIWEKVLSPEHPHVATLVNNYATLLRETHREANAAQLEAQWATQQPSRAWLGIQMKLSTDPPGVLVEQVMAGSPAAHAGIQPQDVVIRFNAQEVPDPPTLRRMVEATAIGISVDVEIIHEGQRRTIPVTLERLPPSKP